MNVNFYKKTQIKSPNTRLKIEHSILFLDYLAHFISNSATKRVQGYGTVGLAHNTVRTYKSLFRIVKAYEFEKSERLYLNSIDKYTAESFTRFLKIEQQYSDNYCGQLLKLLKIILRDAEKSGLEVHPYSSYIESFSSYRFRYFRLLKKKKKICCSNYICCCCSFNTTRSHNSNWFGNTFVNSL